MSDFLYEIKQHGIDRRRAENELFQNLTDLIRRYDPAIQSRDDLLDTFSYASREATSSGNTRFCEQWGAVAALARSEILRRIENENLQEAW